MPVSALVPVGTSKARPAKAIFFRLKKRNGVEEWVSAIQESDGMRWIRCTREIAGFGWSSSRILPDILGYLGS